MCLCVAMHVAFAILVVFPGSFCGSIIMQRILKARVEERASMRVMGLEGVVTHAELRQPILYQARGLFVAVAFWNAILLFCAAFVAQMRVIKIALIVASWVLFPVAARAASFGGMLSHRLELYLFTWLVFYGAYAVPRLASPFLVLGYMVFIG